MELSTTNEIYGKEIKQHLGLVTGNTIRARHVGRDILAGLKKIVGGEISDYTKMMAEAREQALDRMKEQAHVAGGNAVIEIRFSTSMVMSGASEILVYGTAVTV